MEKKTLASGNPVVARSRTESRSRYLLFPPLASSVSLDKMMEAMEAAAAANATKTRDGRELCKDAGAMLLALIRDGGGGGKDMTDSADSSNADSGDSQRHKTDLGALLDGAAAAAGVATPSASAAATSPSPSPGGLSAGAGESKIRYDRDFLFSCADSPLCREMPQALRPKLRQFPTMARGHRSGADGEDGFNGGKVNGGGPSQVPYFQRVGGGGGGGYHRSGLLEDPVGFGPKRAPPSIVDSLPLRPTAQIFTWDPSTEQWVPRARPQEA